MLHRGFVLFVEGVFFAHASVFAVLKLVVAAFLVFALEFIDERLLHHDLLLLFLRYFILGNTKINLRLETPDIRVKALFARDPMVRVKLVEGILQQLVSAVEHHNGERERLHGFISEWLLYTKSLLIFSIRFPYRHLKQPSGSFFVFYLWHVDCSLK